MGSQRLKYMTLSPRDHVWSNEKYSPQTFKGRSLVLGDPSYKAYNRLIAK